MMFALDVTAARDRAIVTQKARAMLKKGPGGVVRLARNGLRIASGRWEHPAPADFWRRELATAGFADVDVSVLSHEGGIASGVRR